MNPSELNWPGHLVLDTGPGQFLAFDVTVRKTWTERAQELHSGAPVLYQWFATAAAPMTGELFGRLIMADECTGTLSFAANGATGQCRAHWSVSSGDTDIEFDIFGIGEPPAVPA